MVQLGYPLKMLKNLGSVEKYKARLGNLKYTFFLYLRAKVLVLIAYV